MGTTNSITIVQIVEKLDLEKQIRALSKERKDLIRRIFDSLAPGSKPWLITCGYGTTIWRHRQFMPDPMKGLPVFKNPIGVVTRSVLEVAEGFVSEKHKIRRRRAATVLRPGEFFGLFEAFANLHGESTITAGIRSFFISNRLGDEKLLKKKDRKTKVEIEKNVIASLAHKTNASYDYSNLIGQVDPKQWSADFLVFDKDHVDSWEIRGPLCHATLLQMKSLVLQNPSLSLLSTELLTETGDIAVGEIDWNPTEYEVEKTVRAIDAMVDGHIPLFRLALGDADEMFLPWKSIATKLEDLLRNARQKLHVWIPDTFSSGAKIALYVQPLSEKFKIASMDDISRECSSRPYQTSTKSQITRIDRMPNELLWTTQSGQKARLSIIRRRTQSEKDILLPKPLEDLLAEGKAWPPHLSSMISFQKM